MKSIYIYLIFIALIISLIVSLIKLRIIYNVHELPLFSGKSEYRLGDMVNNKRERSFPEGEKYHYSEYPNSIASEYMKRTDLQREYDILYDIVKNKYLDNLPTKNMAIVHLRVGDVVECNKNSIHNILTKITFVNSKKWSNYTPPISYYADKIDNIKSHNIDTIIIVAGSHKDISLPKTTIYINSIKQLFEKCGFKVILRLGQDPDKDFIFMSKSYFYIPSTGGNYTNIIKEVVKRNGGKIL